MVTQFRNLLLCSAGAAALFAAGSAAAAPVAYGGGSSLAQHTYQSIFSVLTLTSKFNYTTSGSGAAQTAFLTNSLVPFVTAPTTGTTPDFPNVDFGASDAALTTTQIGTFTGPGALIQVPTFGTPITITANSLTSDGQINLSEAQVCGIFSGTITQWSAIPNAGTTGQIVVVYRADGSGTSFLLTQHLGAVCHTLAGSGFTTSFAGTTTFASLFPSGFPAGSSFVGVSLSSGVQTTVHGTANTIGYLSPDYTHIAPSPTPSSAAAPFVAEVNGALPNQTNTANTLALATIPGEGSNTIPVTTTDPTHWVPTIASPPVSATIYPIAGYTTLEVAQEYNNSTIAADIVAFLDGMLNEPNTAFSTAQSKLAVNAIIAGGFVPLPGVTNSAAPSSGSLADVLYNTFLTGTGSLAITTGGSTAR